VPTNSADNSKRLDRAIRSVLAVLVCIAGSAQIASLWMRPLSEAAVMDAVLGATYLILAIGLFGQSRFSLFMTALVPGGMAIAIATSSSELMDIERLRLSADSLVALGSVLLLWRARNDAKV
jgi:hypothetical protein